MGGMPYVKNKNMIIMELNSALPKCEILYY